MPEIDPKVEAAEIRLAVARKGADLAVEKAYQEHKRAVAALKDAKRDAEKGAEDE
jgi:hypothetical protein